MQGARSPTKTSTLLLAANVAGPTGLERSAAVGPVKPPLSSAAVATQPLPLSSAAVATQPLQVVPTKGMAVPTMAGASVKLMCYRLGLKDWPLWIPRGQATHVDIEAPVGEYHWGNRLVVSWGKDPADASLAVVNVSLCAFPVTGMWDAAWKTSFQEGKIGTRLLSERRLLEVSIEHLPQHVTRVYTRPGEGPRCAVTEERRGGVYLGVVRREHDSPVPPPCTPARTPSSHPRPITPFADDVAGSGCLRMVAEDDVRGMSLVPPTFSAGFSSTQRITGFVDGAGSSPSLKRARVSDIQQRLSSGDDGNDN